MADMQNREFFQIKSAYMHDVLEQHACVKEYITTA